MYYRAYQKLSHVLLCEDDHGTNAGHGTPTIRANYDDCILDQSTTILDKNGQEIFENDVIILSDGNQIRKVVVGSVPDMYKSRKLHPLKSVMDQYYFQKPIDQLDIEIVGHAHNLGSDPGGSDPTVSHIQFGLDAHSDNNRKRQ